MKTIRFETNDGNVHWGIPIENGQAEICEGKIFETLRPTGKNEKIKRLLAPVEPSTSSASA